MPASGTIGPPVHGEWLVLNPPGHSPHAFDLVAVDPGTGRYASRSGWRILAGLSRAEDFHGWSQPVLAPLDGEVVVAHDGERDRDRLVPLVDLPAGFLVRPLIHGRQAARMAGNHVIIATSVGCVLLAHLQQHSVAVRPGERVAAGRQLGRVGHSGNSLAPHLHIQVMDGADPSSTVVPFRVARFDTRCDGAWQERTEQPLPARATRVRFPPS